MPVLRVEDLTRAIDWYIHMLGFEVCWRADENCMLEAGDLALLLSTGSHLGGKPSFTGTLYFEMERVEELFDRIGNVAEIVWPLSRTTYGTIEFGIKDCDGYTLAFSEQAV